MTRPSVLLMTLMLVGCVAAEPVTAPQPSAPSRRTPALAAEVDNPESPPTHRGPAHWPQTLVLAVELDHDRPGRNTPASGVRALELLAAQLADDLGVPVVLAEAPLTGDPAPARIHLRIAAIDRAIADRADVVLQGVRDGHTSAPMVWVTADAATCAAVHGADGPACGEDRDTAAPLVDVAAISPDGDAFVAAATDGRTIATAAHTPTERRYVTATLAALTGDGIPQITHLVDLAAVAEVMVDEPSALISLPRDEFLRLGDGSGGLLPDWFVLATGPAVPIEVVAVHQELPEDLVAAIRESFLRGLTDPYRAAALLDVSSIEAWKMPDPGLIDAAALVAQR